MAKNKGHLEVKRFVSDQGKNQYLLISGNEAAVIDVSDAVDEVSKHLEKMGLTLKYVLVSHAHQSHVAALPCSKRNSALPSVCMNTNTSISKKRMSPRSRIRFCRIMTSSSWETLKLKFCSQPDIQKVLSVFGSRRPRLFLAAARF